MQNKTIASMAACLLLWVRCSSDLKQVMRNMCALVVCSSFLLGCQSEPAEISYGELNDRVESLLAQIKENMVLIEGGTFVMGDFGAVGEDGVWRPYFPSMAEINMAHEVKLSSYSINKHKTTWEDYDTYLLINDLEVVRRNHLDEFEREPFDQDSSSRFYVDKPARVTWQEAKSYCLWLGEQSGHPVGLPTSAQWEFAGRNRGSDNWVFSTHDGRSRGSDPELAKLRHNTGEYVPVGSRMPANPLGIYDMADNGKEWVNDWFSETYYMKNPRITDPQGPGEGTRKVLRNLDFSFSRIGMREITESPFGNDLFLVSQYTFRCALQSPEPLPDSKL